MVLPMQSGPDTVSPIIERVLHSVSRTVRIEHKKLNISCSTGVAVYPEDGADYATLLRNADAAMYRAKESGDASSRSREKVVHLRVASGRR
jgi:diguanylate cyclase (GGDEF)-like protein